MYICQLGSAIGSQWLWTPVILLNSPYQGSATGSSSTTYTTGFTIASGGLSLSSSTSRTTSDQISASNGQAKGFFELDQWTLYTTYNQWQPGGVIDRSCTQPYVAKITAPCSSGPNGCALLVQELLSPGSQSDQNEKTAISYNGYSSVRFHNEYTSRSGVLYVCAPPYNHSTSTTTLTSRSLTVTITLQGSGVSYSTSGTYSESAGVTNAYSYSFPSVGTWNYQELGSSGGAWAFQYVSSSC